MGTERERQSDVLVTKTRSEPNRRKTHICVKRKDAINYKTIETKLERAEVSKQTIFCLRLEPSNVLRRTYVGDLSAKQRGDLSEYGVGQREQDSEMGW